MGYRSNYDIVGGALDAATKAYALVNAPEDRRRQQEREDQAMETARLQQEAARMSIEQAKQKIGDEDWTRKRKQAEMELEAGRISPEIDAWLAENDPEWFDLHGVHDGLVGLKQTSKSMLAAMTSPQQDMAAYADLENKFSEQAIKADRSRFGHLKNPFVRPSLLPDSAKTGNLAMEVEYDEDQPDGTTVRKTGVLTQNRSTDPHDLVNIYTVNGLMTNVDAKLQRVRKAIAAKAVLHGDDTVYDKMTKDRERKEQFAAIESSDFMKGMPPAYRNMTKSFIGFAKATDTDPAALKQQLSTFFAKAAELEINEAEMGVVTPALQKAFKAVEGTKGGMAARMSVGLAAIGGMKLKPTAEAKVIELFKNTIQTDVAAENNIKAAAIKATSGETPAKASEKLLAAKDKKVARFLNMANPSTGKAATFGEAEEWAMADTMLSSSSDWTTVRDSKGVTYAIPKAAKQSMDNQKPQHYDMHTQKPSGFTVDQGIQKLRASGYAFAMPPSGLNMARTTGSALTNEKKELELADEQPVY